MALVRWRPRALQESFINPRSIANLKLWLKADAIVDLVDGDAVATWFDGSGQGNNATQGTASARPLLKKGIINGRPVVRFDGTNDGLTVAALTLGEHTVFAVFKLSSTAGIIYEHGDPNAANGMWLYATNPAIRVDRAGVSSQKNRATNWAVDGVPKIVTHAYAGTHATHTLAINGVAQSMTDSNSGEPGAGAHTAALSIGARGGGTSLPSTGDVAEMLVYDRALSLGDQYPIEQYLKTKYHIS